MTLVRKAPNGSSQPKADIAFLHIGRFPGIRCSCTHGSYEQFVNFAKFHKLPCPSVACFEFTLEKTIEWFKYLS